MFTQKGKQNKQKNKKHMHNNATCMNNTQEKTQQNLKWKIKNCN